MIELAAGPFYVLITLCWLGLCFVLVDAIAKINALEMEAEDDG